MNIACSFSFAAVVLLSAITTTDGLAMDKRIEIVEAVQIAERALTEGGHADPNRSVVLARKLDTPRDDIFGERSDKASQDLRKKLEGKEYWLIYLRPAAGKGGDAAIYINAQTGEVLHVYLGR